MHIATIDTETYFDVEYSLKKLTTEEYVRDPRFKLHCLGITRGEHSGAVCGTDITSASLGCLSKTSLVAHHAQFDGLVLSHHYNVKPAFWFDTLSMARLLFPHAKSHSLAALAEMLGLPEKTVPYEDFKGVRELSPELYRRVAAGCADDVKLTHEIFKRMLPHVPRSELRIIDLTIRMFTEPTLGLNREALAKYLADTRDQKEDLLAACGVTKEDVGSSDKFAAILKSFGVEPPTKISARTGKVAYAFAKTDQGLKELLGSSDPRVKAVTEARLGIKSSIGESRSERMLNMDSRGAMCVYLKYYGAHTGRWSGGDAMNWQNFTRGSTLRTSILAPKGSVMVVIDSAQIECRILNWLAGQQDILEAFKNGEDLYSQGASRFYGRTITKQDKLERHLGKTLELGCGYGMGFAKFQITCKQGALGGPPIILDGLQAREAVNSYRTSHPRVVELWKRADRILQSLQLGTATEKFGPMRIENRRVYYPNGAWSDYTHLRNDGREFYTETREGRAKIYGAKLVENVVQALARTLMAEWMLAISKRYKIVTTTHDEVVYLAPEPEADQALKFGLSIMKSPPAWCSGLPLDAEGGYAANYSK